MSASRGSHGLFIKTLAVLLALAAQACFVRGLRAQTGTASVNGTIGDQNGASLPHAAVTIVNQEKGWQRETTANERGFYQIPLLLPGHYTLTAVADGFGTVTVTDIVLQLSINTTLNVTLKPRAVKAFVMVTAQSNTVETNDATVKYSVTKEQVSGLPVMTSVFGRNVLNSLPYLVPGVSSTRTNLLLPGIGNRGEELTINGSRSASISFNFEGGDNNDYEYNRAASPLPNPDALQEFTVLTNNYSADTGRSSGGVINAIARSGSNEYHGNARVYIVNEAFNARGFFDRDVPLNRLYTYGGNLGGPVKIPGLFNGRNRLQFFFDFEGTRSTNEQQRTFTVIPEAFRHGDFSSAPPEQRPRDPLTGQLFTGGIIPAERINPISRLYLDRYIPSPNTGVSKFVTNNQYKRGTDQVTTRLDYRINESDSISGTYFTTLSNINSFSSLLPLDNVLDNSTYNHNFNFRETHMFSSKTINQFTATLTRFLEDFLEQSPSAAGIHPRELGFTTIRPQTEGAYLSIPSIILISSSGLTPLFTGDGSTNAKTTWQLKDDLTHVSGDHTWKLGGEVFSFSFNKTTANSNGAFGFSTNAFGSRNPIADFLLGIPTSYDQLTGNDLYPRQRGYALYGMDTWKAMPNLTLTYGLRYELTPPLTEKYDRLSVFRAGQKSTVFPQAPAGLLFVGDSDPVLGKVPRGGYQTDKNNVAPRVGIAYSPMPDSGLALALFGHGKTSIRTGFGVFYDQTYGYGVTQISYTPPFSLRLSLNAATINNAGGTFANPFGNLPNPFPYALSARQFPSSPIDIQPFDPSFRTAYTFHYNLGVQRELPWSLLAEVAYVGNNGFKQNRKRNLNPGLVRPETTYDTAGLERPFAAYRNIISQESTGRSRYDALQARLSRRFGSSLMFDVSYVFSKVLNDVPNLTALLEIIDLGSTSIVPEAALESVEQSSWARASFDRRHNFVLSFTYDVPSIKGLGFAGLLLNGWQIGGITEFRSGVPIDIGQLDDPELTGEFGRGRPDIVGPFIRYDPRKEQTIIVDGVARTGHFYFDPRSFKRVEVENGTQARPGSLGRNVFNGPGVNLTSASIAKRFRLSDAQSMELRADISNLFNHAQFFAPVRTLDYDDFGQVGADATNVSTGRNIQFSLRYTF